MNQPKEPTAAIHPMWKSGDYNIKTFDAAFKQMLEMIPKPKGALIQNDKVISSHQFQGVEWYRIHNYKFTRIAIHIPTTLSFLPLFKAAEVLAHGRHIGGMPQPLRKFYITLPVSKNASPKEIVKFGETMCEPVRLLIERDKKISKLVPFLTPEVWNNRDLSKGFDGADNDFYRMIFLKTCDNPIEGNQADPGGVYKGVTWFIVNDDLLPFCRIMIEFPQDHKLFEFFRVTNVLRRVSANADPSVASRYMFWGELFEESMAMDEEDRAKELIDQVLALA